jgi:hypothetical protein
LHPDPGIGGRAPVTCWANRSLVPLTDNSGIVLAIAKPAGGNYVFGEFLTATELGTS